MNHPCFAKMKKESKEIVAETPVIIEFEEQELDKSMLRQLFLKACSEIQSDPDFRK